MKLKYGPPQKSTEFIQKRASLRITEVEKYETESDTCTCPEVRNLKQKAC